MDSLLQQDYPNIKIHIRDDGSSDETQEILTQYAEKYPQKVTITLGENIGFFHSFMTLLSEKRGENDFYAWCDQDDIWESSKISAALDKIRDREKPALYFSRITFFDDESDAKHKSDIPKTIGFRNALVENVVAGCTTLFNEAARSLITKHIPEKPLLHDWWAYLIISAVGEIIYDKESYISCRRHSGNQTQHISSLISKNKERIERNRSGHQLNYLSAIQAKIFGDYYSKKLNNDDQKVLQEYLQALDGSLVSRIRYAIKTPLIRNNRVDQLLFRALLIAGKIPR